MAKDIKKVLEEVGDDAYGYSYEQIAKTLGITVREVKKIEASAMKKLSHPKIGKQFKDYINMEIRVDDDHQF